MQTRSDVHASGRSLTDADQEDEPDLEVAGLDGTVVDRRAVVRRRFERRVRREVAMFGSEAARRYICVLLELDSDWADRDDLYEEAERALEFGPGEVRRLVESG